MDNWGDPWADNADSSTKSPTKDAVTSPLHTTFAAAPTILGGFLDDAGWGNEDESFGDWSTPAVEHVEQTPAAHTELNITEPDAHSPVLSSWNTVDEKDGIAVRDDGGWAAVRLDAYKDEDRVVSESSDASTTVQAKETTDCSTSVASTGPLKDDVSSARTSTSPSEASHNDIPVESPRTSCEEERGVVKAATIEEVGFATHLPNLGKPNAETPGSHGFGGGIDNVLSDTQPAQDGRHLAGSILSAISNPSEDSSPLPHATSVVAQPFLATHSRTPVPRTPYPIDPGLLAKLLTPQKEEEQLGEPPDDPIHSTAARKAWYRLTRKQTMREFNTGNDDDNYIRVTWADSCIKSEVNNIVGRWAREDRISGTGPGARASFYWDTSAPIDPKPMADHMRQKASKHKTTVVAGTQEGDPLPLTNNIPAAFSWSSTTTSTDPWQQPSPGLRSTSSPIAPIFPPVNHLQKQEGRVVSLDLTSHKPETTKHARNLTATNETPIVADLSSPATTNTTTFALQPWTALDLFDNNTNRKDNIAAPTATDDVDDWGEMVSSPTVSTPTLTEPTSRVDTRDNTFSTSVITPQSIRSVNVRDQSPDAMHGTPIVRLKSTISPTSALFKPNLFVPIGLEQGLIGPGMLKPSKRAVSNARRPAKAAPPKTQPDSESAIAPKLPEPKDTLNHFSALQNSVPEVVDTQSNPASATVIEQKTVRPSTPPPPPTPASKEQSSVDAWADADFSIFESSVLAPELQPDQDSLDTFSMFQTRERSTSAASSAKTFTRSPPRKVPSPPIQPLTSATSSAQRRKMEEDAVVQGIMHGLPDLSYMLR